MSWHRLHIFQYGEISYNSFNRHWKRSGTSEKNIYIPIEIKTKVKFMFAIYAQRVEKEVEWSHTNVILVSSIRNCRSILTNPARIICLSKRHIYDKKNRKKKNNITPP